MINDIILHTMEHNGDRVRSTIFMQKYSDDYYDDYKQIYEDCFYKMRSELELYPINAGDSKEELQEKANNIYLYFEDNILIGSVAIFDNEIDELIVAKGHQKKGYGKLILNYAISRMQEANISPIILQVTDWNKGAIKLYQDNGFSIVKTESIKHPGIVRK